MTDTRTILDKTETRPVAATGSVELTDGSQISMTALRGVQAIGNYSGPLDATEPGDVTLTITSADGERKTVAIPDDLQYPFVLMVRAMVNAANSRDRDADQTRRDNV